METVGRELQDYVNSGVELKIDAMSPTRTGRLQLGAEPGGSLQLHTGSDSDKHALIGIMNYANSAMRAWRAFLADPPVRNLDYVLVNRAYSRASTCHEATQRKLFERNILDYIHLATKLAVLPLKRSFRRTDVVDAVLDLTHDRLELRASDILVDGEQLFASSLVLGPNARSKGWCSWSDVPLRLVLHAARVEPGVTRWQHVERLADAFRSEPSKNIEQLQAGMDEHATSAVPALVGVDQRPVFSVAERAAGECASLRPGLCGYGVLDEGAAGLASRGPMYCMDCGDCTTYFEGARIHRKFDLHDCEDLRMSAGDYFHRVADRGTRKRLFSLPGHLVNKERKMQAPPLAVKKIQGAWCFRAYTSEDCSPLKSSLASPARLQDWPGVHSVLSASAEASCDMLAAEAQWLSTFSQQTGGMASWVERAHACVVTLIASARELELELKRLTADVSR